MIEEVLRNTTAGGSVGTLPVIDFYTGHIDTVMAAGARGQIWAGTEDKGIWRFDPHTATATLFLGDGARGLDLEATPPGLNRVGGFGYDGARGILFVSDSVENTVIAIQ